MLTDMSHPTLDPRQHRQFASDNYAGLCPSAAGALARANAGHLPAYGDDPWTARAVALLRQLFETPCEVFFCFNGTAANCLALSSVCQPHHAVVCHEVSHLITDECGAAGFFGRGLSLHPQPGPAARLLPETVDRALAGRGDVHSPLPRAVSLTQATEWGTVYPVATVREIAAVTHRHNALLHMDGARLANALAELGCTPAELTWRAGVDVLCLGGTKNGLAIGEAVLFFRPELAAEFAWRCKQAGQLASKMRFLTAPWVGLLESGDWLANALHANDMARRLDQRLRQLPGLQLLAPRQANSVFVQLPQPVLTSLRDAGWRFYTFIGDSGVRLMCSWDTTPADVDAFVADLERRLPEQGATI